MTIDELIDVQEAGSRARVLGRSAHDNPYRHHMLIPRAGRDGQGDLAMRHDAWKFGWECEDAVRRDFSAVFELPPAKGSLR